MVLSDQPKDINGYGYRTTKNNNIAHNEQK